MVDGYSSDEESDVVEDKTDDKDGDSDSLDEEAIERKMEIFERIQAERMKKLEGDACCCYDLKILCILQ